MLKPCMLGILLVSISACAVKPDLQGNNIRLLKINEQVEIIKKELYNDTPYREAGSSSNASAEPAAIVFVMFMGLVDAMTREKGSLTDILASKNIDIKTLLKNELAQQLGEAQSLRLVAAQEKVDAILNIEVYQYGVDSDWSFRAGTLYKPYIDIIVTVTRPDDGRILWSAQSKVQGKDLEIPGYTQEDYFSDSTAMRDSFRRASEVVIRRALINLNIW